MDFSQDQSICHLMGFATLEWYGPGDLRSLGALPPWWSLMDEASAAGNAQFTPNERFPFLENFLIDARDLWEGDSVDRLASGIWQYRSQNGTDLMLEAFAIHTGQQKLLLIQNVTQGGAALEFLQKGRGTQLQLMRDLTRRDQLEIELRASQEQAQRLDQAKTEFVANTSHEMRTPLTTILGMCELLGESQLRDEQKEQLATLEDSARSLLNVVSDLLDVASIEAGKISTKDGEFSPSALLHKVVQDYRLAAAERGIKLSVTIADDLPGEIFSDANRLRQIINNLVDNAIKFTDKGSVTLTTDYYDEGPYPVVQFHVADTGIGIHPNEQPRMFESFEQSANNPTDGEQGFGLGLAIASRLAAAIGGNISLRSSPGKGSVFTLAIPANREMETLAAEPEEKAPNVGPTEVPDTLNLLVAEDNPVNRRFIVHALTRSGHQVTACCNGQEALDAFKANDFDVFLLDCQMPVLDGYDTAAAVRAHEESTGEHLPIIAVTAHAMEENRQRCFQAGMDFFVPKPFKTKELLEAVGIAATHRIRN